MIIYVKLEMMNEIIYTPTNKGTLAQRLRDILRDIAAGHDLGRRLFIRDFKALYRQSFLGIFWAFFPAVMTSFTWIILNQSNIIEVKDVSISYPLFVIVGTILWQVFVDSVSEPLKAVNANKSALIKLNFPREAIIVSAFYSTIVNFLIKLVILVAALFFLDFNLSSSVALFPIGVISTLLVGFAIGILLLPISFLYTDIGKMLPFILQFLMYLTPVIYPEPKFGFFKHLLALNPMSSIITCTRNWLVGTPVENYTIFVFVSLSAVVLIVLGLVVFKKVIPIVIERIGA